jgi:hypothetical protein
LEAGVRTSLFYRGTKNSYKNHSEKGARGVDVEAVERAENEIDGFISRRAKENAEANRIEALWVESTRRYNEKRRRDNRAAWHAFHLSQAECIERTAAELAANHRARAEALAEEPGGGV